MEACAVCTGSLAEELTVLDLQIRQAREREPEQATHAHTHAEDMLRLATAASEGIEFKIVEAHELARNLQNEVTQLKRLNDLLKELLSLKVSEQAVQAGAVERLQMTLDCERQVLVDERRESELNLERLAIIARQKKELAASALSLEALFVKKDQQVERSDQMIKRLMGENAV